MQVSGKEVQQKPFQALFNSPAVHDLSIWILLRTFTALLATPTFKKVMLLVHHQHQAAVSQVLLLRHKWKEGQARAVLAASQAAAARSKRMAKLCDVFQLESSSAVSGLPGLQRRVSADSHRPTSAGRGVGGAGDPQSSAGLQALGRDWGTADVAAVAGLAALLDEDWVEHATPLHHSDSTQSLHAWDSQAGSGQRSPLQQHVPLRGSASMAQLPDSMAPNAAASNLGLAHLSALRIPTRHTSPAAAAAAADSGRKQHSPSHFQPREHPSPAAPPQEDARSPHVAAAAPDNRTHPPWLVSPGPRSFPRPRAAAWRRCMRVLTALQGRVQRHDDESYLCYAAYVLVAVCDFSLLAMAFPVSMVAYALLAQHQARAYWRAVLVYAEAALVAQYSYQLLGRCLCEAADPGTPGALSMARADGHGGGWGRGSTHWPSSSLRAGPPSPGECVWVFGSDKALWILTTVVGLHSSVLRTAPLFCLYLVTLFHTYRLRRLDPVLGPSRGSSSGAAAASPAGHRVGRSSGAGHSWISEERSSAAATVPCSPSGLLGVGVAAATAALGHLLQVYWQVTNQHEVGPHWVKLTLSLPQPESLHAAGGVPNLEGVLQQLAAATPAHSSTAAAAAAAAPPPPPPTPTGTLQHTASSSSTLPSAGPPDPGAPAPHPASETSRDINASQQQPGQQQRQQRQGAETGAPASPDSLHIQRCLQGMLDAGCTWLDSHGASRPALLRLAADSTHGQPGWSRPLGQPGTAPQHEVGWPPPPRSPGDRLGDPAFSFEHPPSPGPTASDHRGPTPSDHSFPTETDPSAVQSPSPRRAPQPTADSQPAEADAPAAPAAAVCDATTARPGPSAAGQLLLRLHHLSPVTQPAHGARDARPQHAHRRVAVLLEVTPAGLGGMHDRGHTRDWWRPPPLMPAGAAARALRVAAAWQHRSPWLPAHPGPQSSSSSQQPEACTSEVQQQQQQQQQLDRPHTGSFGTGTSAAAAAAAGHAFVCPPPPPLPAAICVDSVEAHARRPPDWYTAMALLDISSFIYAALFYQVTLSSEQTLADITNDDKVIPIDYVGALMALFLLLVVERAVYSLGSPRGRAVLHLVGLFMLLPWILSQFWGLTSHVAKLHLRVFALLRLSSLCFGAFSNANGALQLRVGYPALSSAGPSAGRHASFFFAHTDMWTHACYSIFCAVPFLYEIRALLDWSCTATTLDLKRWLTLEDVRSALYNTACVNTMRSLRRLGARIPRYVKLMQGFLMVVLLLLVLWLPLLVFSSGAPTYQTPTVVNAAVNISLVASAYGTAGDALVSEFMLYSAGSRRSVQPWADLNGALPLGLAAYLPDQVKMLCLSQDSDTVWRMTPPARAALMSALASATPPLLRMMYSVQRSGPAVSGRGGPSCSLTLEIPLSAATTDELLQVLQPDATSSTVSLRVPDQTDPLGPGSTALYPRLWRVAGEQCVLKPGDLGGGLALASIACNMTLRQAHHGAEGAALAWDDWWEVQCFPDTSRTNATTRRSFRRVLPQNAPGLGPVHSRTTPTAGVQGGAGGVASAGHAQDARPGTVMSRGVSEYGLGDGGGASGVLFEPPAPEPGPQPDPWASCSSELSGPGAVLVLERVQSGFLGATLSRFGITGLYLSVVYAIGRFLRLSVSNLRGRIPFEELPSTRRLVALCQDIYTARAEGALMLEEELFQVLVSIYRSPAVLFELTRRRKQS
ncbi:MAG: hypothetical protein WDW36_005220 [Sanguina aurantia]